MLKQKIKWRRRDGFGLVAVMISAGIGVFLLLSMTQLTAVSRQSYNSNIEIAHMYDNARFAMNYLYNQVSLAAKNFYASGTAGVWPNGGSLTGAYPYAAGTLNVYPMYIPGYQSLGCRGSNTAWASPFSNTSSPGNNIFGNISTAGGGKLGRPDAVAFQSGGHASVYGAAPGLRFFYMANESFGGLVWQTELITSKMQRSLFLSPNNTSTNLNCNNGYGYQPGGNTEATACCTTGYINCSSLLNGSATYSCGGSEGSGGGGTGNGLHAGWIWERVIPHIQPTTSSFTGTTVGSGTTNGLQNSDTLTIAFTNNSGSSMNNCTNGTISSDTTGNLGHLAYSTFAVGLWNNTAATDATCTSLSSTCLPNLQCKPQTANVGASGTSSGTTLPLIEGIEYMKILLGEDDYGERDYLAAKATSPSRWIDANNALIDWTNIVAVRIALVVRSTNAFLANASQPTLFLMRGAGGTALTYTPSSADKYLRQVFVFTIPLSNFTHRDYPQPSISGSPSSIVSAPNVYPYPATTTYSGSYNGATTPYNYTNGVDYERHCIGMTSTQLASYPPNGGINSSANVIAGGCVLKLGGVRTKYLDGNNGGTQQYLQPGDRCCSSDVVESDNLYQYTGTGLSTAFQCRVFKNLGATSNSCEADRALANNAKCKYFWTVPNNAL